MSITIEIPEQDLADLRQFTRQESDAAAIVRATHEFLRISKLRELKGASGKVDFDPNWQVPESQALPPQ